MEGLNCCCTWTKDMITEKPYLCVAGKDAKVKVWDVKDAKLVTGEFFFLSPPPSPPPSSLPSDMTVTNKYLVDIYWSRRRELARNPPNAVSDILD